MTDIWTADGRGTRQLEEAKYATEFNQALKEKGESLTRIEERKFPDNPPLIIAHIKGKEGCTREVICALSL
jgi:hypothetical protein